MSETDIENLITSLGCCFGILLVMVAMSMVSGYGGPILRGRPLHRWLFSSKEADDAYHKSFYKQDVERMMSEPVSRWRTGCGVAIIVGMVALGLFLLYAIEYSPQFIP